MAAGFLSKCFLATLLLFCSSLVDAQVSTTKSSTWLGGNVTLTITASSTSIRIPAFNLTNLPVAGPPLSEFLPAPANNQSLIQAVSVDWNPQGHEPFSIINNVSKGDGWGVPHFDFHFYLNPVSIIATIQCSSFPPCPNDTTSAKIFILPPSAQYLPAGYSADPTSAVPGQGLHAANVTTGIFQTATNGSFGNWTYGPELIYGTFNGKVSFLEPMITRSWLLSMRNGAIANYTAPWPQPGLYSVSGPFPQSTSVTYYPATDEFVISLDNNKQVTATTTSTPASPAPASAPAAGAPGTTTATPANILAPSPSTTNSTSSAVTLRLGLSWLGFAVLATLITL